MAKKRDVGRLVERDVQLGLGKVFAPTAAGFSLPEPFGEPIGTGPVAAIVWRYEGVHARPFGGVAPTGRTVVIDGVTVIDLRDDEPRLHRYVDWNDVAIQLGVASFGRTLQADPAAEPKPRRRKG